MPMGVCHLCGEERKLITSHIFPEFFFKGTYGEDTRSHISITSHPHHRPRPMQRGPTESLFCQLCDNRIGRFETYAAAVLRRAAEVGENVPRGTKLASVDFPTFRLFGLSLIWRAHLAKNHTFARVNLGPHAGRLREMIRAEDPGEPYQYGFALAKEVGVPDPTHMFIGPSLSRYRGHRAYNWMAAGYHWTSVVSSNTAVLGGQFPFVGSDPDLYIPFMCSDRRKLYAQIRRAFPKAFEK